jgi:hypothetical protein
MRLVVPSMVSQGDTVVIPAERRQAWPQPNLSGLARRICSNSLGELARVVLGPGLPTPPGVSTASPCYRHVVITKRGEWSLRAWPSRPRACRPASAQPNPSGLAPRVCFDLFERKRPGSAGPRPVDTPRALDGPPRNCNVGITSAGVTDSLSGRGRQKLAHGGRPWSILTPLGLPLRVVSDPWV